MTDALKTLSSFLVKDWDVDGLHLEFSDILTPEQRELMEFYDLSLHQAEILSYLTYYHGKRISERKLKELGYQDTFEMDIPKDLSDLAERKFIRREPMRDDCSLYDPSFCYILTEKAYEAFLGDEGFGERYFEDCLTEVLSVDFKHMFSMNWRNAMERSLYTPSNSRLFEKLWDLGFDKLEKSERLAFWVMVRQFFFYFTAPLAFRNSEDILNGTGYSQEVLKSDLGHLVEKGLVQTLPIEPLEDTKDTDRFVLAPKAAGALFHGDKEVIRYEEMAKYADVIKAGDIVPKPLFFSRESEEEIDHLRRMLSEEGFYRACRILKNRRRNPAIASLLWGPPGTGKTEVIKQLARESHRDIILFDPSKVTASAWGATEKFYRSLFRAYNYVALISDNVPILVLNEADSVLSKRLSSVERSIDKSENTISNILLQAFEDLSGILLATTNLIDNLDPAFDRRFLFKTQLSKPDAEARFRIWTSSIPSLSTEEARGLAARFELSGAQIDNVVAKRDLAELYYEGDMGYDYIAGLCEKELSTEKGSSGTRPRIGFTR